MYDNGRQCGGLFFLSSATIINFISFHFVASFLSVSPPILNLTFCCILKRKKNADHQIKMQLKTSRLLNEYSNLLLPPADRFCFIRKSLKKKKKAKHLRHMDRLLYLISTHINSIFSVLNSVGLTRHNRR